MLLKIDFRAVNTVLSRTFNNKLYPSNMQYVDMQLYIQFLFIVPMKRTIKFVKKSSNFKELVRCL